MQRGRSLNLTIQIVCICVKDEVSSLGEYIEGRICIFIIKNIGLNNIRIFIRFFFVILINNK